jgi:hypothetical protein
MKAIPPFQCGYIAPWYIDKGGAISKTKSYDIQCCTGDAKALIALLRATYPDNSAFVFHKLCHSSPEIYHDGIIRQQTFLATNRIIPIQDINCKLMSTLGKDLLSIEVIAAVLHHKQTYTSGRWSLVTTTKYFKTATKQVG